MNDIQKGLQNVGQVSIFFNAKVRQATKKGE